MSQNHACVSRVTSTCARMSRLNCGWCVLYYGDVTLECSAYYITIKTTYNHVLYLFVNSLTWFALALADLKVTWCCT